MSVCAYSRENYDDVAKLGAKLANLRMLNGLYSLGVEIEGSVLDVAATAITLNLPAPQDMDDLLQQFL